MVHEPPGSAASSKRATPPWSRSESCCAVRPTEARSSRRSRLLDTLHVWNRQGVGLGDPERHTRAVMAQRAWRTAHRRGGAPPVEQAPAPVVPAVLDGFVPTEPEEAAAPVDAGVAMRGALAALPAQQRVVLVLRFWGRSQRGRGRLGAALLDRHRPQPRCPGRRRPARASACSRRHGRRCRRRTEDRRIEQLLTRAADVPPVSTQPTDDVLARAELGPRARFRRRRVLAVAAVVVGCALLIGAGAVALSDGDRPSHARWRRRSRCA